MAVAARAIPEGAATRAPRTGGALVAGVLLTLALGGAFIVRSAFDFHGRTFFSLFDDSMISMTYARNLAEGHGLVWNAGGERVEGFTNLLWTLCMAVPHVLGASDASSSLYVMLIGVALLVANLFVVRAIATALAPGVPRVAQLAVLATALLYPLLYWTLRGMEVGLLTLLVSSSVLLALRAVAAPTRGWIMALAGVLAAGVLTRDDSLTWGVAVVAFVAWRARGAALWPALALGAALAVKTGFRLAYFGEALPNTYYLKLGGEPLGERLPRGAVAVGSIGLLELYAPLALAAVGLLRSRGPSRAALLLPAGLVPLQCAYSLYVGGDVWEFLGLANRYITPAIPCLLVVAALGLHRLLEGGRAARPSALALGSAFGLVALLNLALSASSRAETELVLRLTKAPDRTAAVLVAVLLAAFGVAVWRRAPRAAFAIGSVLLIAATTGDQLVRWATHDAAYVRADADMARYGLLLGEVTPRGTTVAVAWAGAIPYFARRDAVDLLGKSDRTIARSPRQPVPFQPGHDKWDYDHSVGRLRPQVVAQLVRFDPRDASRLVQWGYEPLGALTLPDRDWAQLFAMYSLPAPVRGELRRRLPEIAGDS